MTDLKVTNMKIADIPPLLLIDSAKLADLQSRLGRVGVRIERPQTKGVRLGRDGKVYRLNTSVPIKDCEDWFWSNVAMVKSGCWEWQGAARRYGLVETTPTHVLAHRTAAMFVLGKYPELLVRHHCDNRLCVNPNHLFLGTTQQNTEDARQNGRIRNRPKLNKFQVWDIIESTENSKALASRFGITPHHVRAIKRGKHWRRVTW